MTVYDAIRGWADSKGLYDSGDSKTQFIKLGEEVGELAQGLLTEDKELIKDSIGDCVIVLVSLARMENLNLEDCVESAYTEIKNRQGIMKNGTFQKFNHP